MKTVGDSRWVARQWAQGAQPHARSHSEHFYFDGDTIFSYGSHFPIARRIGLNLFLFTTRDYSVTTAKHKSWVWRAIPSFGTVIYVNNVRAVSAREREENMAALVETLKKTGEKLKRARTRKEIYREEMERQTKNIGLYAQYADILPTERITISFVAEGYYIVLDGEEFKASFEKLEEAIAYAVNELPTKPLLMLDDKGEVHLLEVGAEGAVSVHTWKKGS